MWAEIKRGKLHENAKCFKSRVFGNGFVFVVLRHSVQQIDGNSVGGDDCHCNNAIDNGCHNNDNDHNHNCSYHYDYKADRDNKENNSLHNKYDSNDRRSI